MLSCVCCKARQSRKDKKYFILETGELSRVTRDHVLLRSLGGEEIKYMCDRCNTLRGNYFAEQDEFVQWFRESPNKIRPTRNFSYIKDKHILPRTERYSDGSTELPVYQLKDGMYREYIHPLFGKSLIKIS